MQRQCCSYSRTIIVLDHSMVQGITLQRLPFYMRAFRTFSCRLRQDLPDIINDNYQQHLPIQQLQCLERAKLYIKLKLSDLGQARCLFKGCKK